MLDLLFVMSGVMLAAFVLAALVMLVPEPRDRG